MTQTRIPTTGRTSLAVMCLLSSSVQSVKDSTECQLQDLFQIHLEDYGEEETLIRLRFLGHTVVLDTLPPLERILIRQAPETITLIGLAHLRRVAMREAAGAVG